MNTSNPPAPGAPNQDKRPIFFLVAGIFAIMLIIPIVFFIWPEYQNEKLLETGTPAEAKILSIEPTGTIVNSQYQYRIQLEVYPENGDAYQAETKAIINAIYAPQFQPGMYFHVKYDPENPNNVAMGEYIGENPGE